MTLEAGRLRHLVTLERQNRSRDSTTGAVNYEWERVADVWAAIEPLSAREFIAASATQSKVTARIVIRYRSDVTAAMRVVHGATQYNIEGVLSDKDSGREYLTLAVSSGVNEGG